MLERFTRKRVVTVDADATVLEVARAMESEHVGAVLVVEGGVPIGIVTDRDLALRVLARGNGPTACVREVMTREPVTIGVDALLDEALYAMRNSGVRRLPIVDSRGKLVGLVALDDLMVLLSAELSSGAQAVLDNRGP